MSKERITVELDEGTVRIYVNETGLERLVSEMQALDKSNDHFHLNAPEWSVEGEPLSLKSYDGKSKTAGHLKVLFRPDEWDREHYPHLFE